MTKYRVYGILTGVKYLGTFEAENEDDAVDQAANNADVNICANCSKEIKDLEIDDFDVCEITEEDNS